MGEYYMWVNVDKKEYLDLGDFWEYGGCKWVDQSGWDYESSLALRSLLANEWKGDRIGWVGDECSISSKASNPFLRVLYQDYTKLFGDDSDACGLLGGINGGYRNISGLFKAAEKGCRKNIERFLKWRDKVKDDPDYCLSDFNPDFEDYGIKDWANPYNGMFLREGEDFKYVVNRDKRVFYAKGETKVRWYYGEIEDDMDPLFFLMSYGCGCTGLWLGDVVDVSDERPEGCTFIKEINIDDVYSSC